MSWQYVHEGNAIQIGDKIYELPASRTVFVNWLAGVPYEIYQETKMDKDGCSICYGMRKLKQKGRGKRMKDANPA